MWQNSFSEAPLNILDFFSISQLKWGLHTWLRVDWKYGNGKCGTIKNARAENAGVESVGPKLRGWKEQDWPCISWTRSVCAKSCKFCPCRLKYSRAALVYMRRLA